MYLWQFWMPQCWHSPLGPRCFSPFAARARLAAFRPASARLEQPTGPSVVLGAADRSEEE
ncbi:hypothetical protein CHLRE_02g111426v5 [Chlamydomonas reinhardtii]|uniref:Uncharacterized protein n=1 Tax=Chlamydomonas reinhardtii TaxID=3055 RepID=A0A2K3E303_CHLRE|nr:uncharacterized protein CHLRE_02g111426v5 [Chlamydomonas reinhardtii]PNW87162.1 hypothetical protein CHLRE_02g111426v5 [Chlamydomonas reinhardtii]